jgi:hypothetical protein
MLAHNFKYAFMLCTENPTDPYSEFAWIYYAVGVQRTSPLIMRSAHAVWYRIHRQLQEHCRKLARLPFE